MNIDNEIHWNAIVIDRYKKNALLFGKIEDM